MDLLISGANGFVGSSLIPRLAKAGEYRISGLVRRRSEARFLRGRGADRLMEYGNLEKRGSFHSWIHLAGKTNDLGRVSPEQQQAYFEANVGLTKKLYDRFRKDPKAEHFIFVSSAKAVADDPGGPVDEQMPPHPRTAYGISKLEAENYIRDNGAGEKKVWILRPCMIHGPGHHGNLRDLFSFIARGFPWPLGKFENERSFLSVDNFSFVVHRILSGDLAPGTYHLADTGTFSTNELVDMMAQAAGLKTRIWNLPRGMWTGTARAGDFLRLPWNSGRLRKLTGDYVVSNRKLRNELGEELPLTAEEGMWKSLRAFSMV